MKRRSAGSARCTHPPTFFALPSDEGEDDNTTNHYAGNDEEPHCQPLNQRPAEDGSPDSGSPLDEEPFVPGAVPLFPGRLGGLDHLGVRHALGGHARQVVMVRALVHFGSNVGRRGVVVTVVWGVSAVAHGDCLLEKGFCPSGHENSSPHRTNEYTTKTWFCQA